MTGVYHDADGQRVYVETVVTDPLLVHALSAGICDHLSIGYADVPDRPIWAYPGGPVVTECTVRFDVGGEQ